MKAPFHEDDDDLGQREETKVEEEKPPLSELDRLLSELGPFKPNVRPDYGINVVRHIPDLTKLLFRYKPEYHGKFSLLCIINLD